MSAQSNVGISNSGQTGLIKSYWKKSMQRGLSAVKGTRVTLKNGEIKKVMKRVSCQKEIPSKTRRLAINNTWSQADV